MEIYAYSGMHKEPVNKKQKNGLESAGKKQNRNVVKRMEYKLSEKNGVVMAVVPDDVSKENVEELLELVGKKLSYERHIAVRQKKEKFRIICGLWQKNQKTLYISDRSLTKQIGENKIISRTEIAADAG